jgi:tetratricopeptide (TPR) repeat protein
MSTLLLKMFTLDPGSYSLIRQSTELAAQTYDLDHKSDLAIAALANILEATGENERGLSLLSDASKRGIALGWRSDLAKARLLFNGKNADTVLAVLSHALAENDASSELIAPTLISAILSRYDGDEQINELRKWAKRRDCFHLELALANSLALNSRYDEAMSVYKRILTIKPDNTEALMSQGIIALRHLKQPDIAIAKFKGAVSSAKHPSDKTAAQTHLALALIAWKKDFTAANRASVAAISDASDQEGVLFAILAAYRKNGDTSLIMSLLEGLEKNVPGLHMAHAMKGELLSEKFGRYSDATRAFTDAITLEPGRSEYYNGRGLAWMGMGNLINALTDFENAAATNPDDASARYNVACAQARLGQKDDAMASLAKALEMDARLRSNARTDQDLIALRKDPAFKALLDESSKQVSVAH